MENFVKLNNGETWPIAPVSGYKIDYGRLTLAGATLMFAQKQWRYVRLELANPSLGVGRAMTVAVVTPESKKSELVECPRIAKVEVSFGVLALYSQDQTYLFGETSWVYADGSLPFPQS